MNQSRTSAFIRPVKFACQAHGEYRYTGILQALLSLSNMKPVAPGTVIFHRYRGYGVITSVNLLTGWISARFGAEGRTPIVLPALRGRVGAAF